jgi:PAS domain S-box-containing protein
MAVLPALAILLISGPAKLTLGQSLLLALLAGLLAAGLSGWLGRRILAPLRASEEHHRILFKEAPVGIFRFDPGGVIQDCNPAFAAIIGAPREAILGLPMLQRIEHAGVRSAVEEALQGRVGHQEGEYVSITAQKRSVARLITYPITGDDGRALGGIGIVEDVTDRHRIEAALRESEARLDLFFSQSVDAYYIAELEAPLQYGEIPTAEAVAASLDRQRLTHSNLALAVQLGVAKTALDRWTFRDLFGHDPAAASSDAAELLEQGHLRREICVADADGQPRWIEWDCICYFDPEGRIAGHFGIRRDITERRRTEEVLRHSEQRTRMLFDAVNDAIFVHDLETGAILDVNARALEMYGYSRPEFLRMDVADLSEGLRPFSQAEAMAWIRKARREGPQVFEWRARHRSARTFWVEVNMRQAFIGAEERLLVAVRDIEGRKAAEAALRDAEERYLGLFMNSPDAIFWIGVGEDGRFILESLNPAQEATLGRPGRDIVGRELSDWLPADLAGQLTANYRRCVEEGRPITYEESADLGHGRRSFQTLLVPIRNAGGRIHRIAGISTDITARRSLEAQIQQAQKLESLGVLAGGIAHDFNNLLTAVLGNLNLAQFSLNPESPAAPFLENAEKAVQKASDLTRQMLAYSGRGRFVVKLHDVNEVVQEMAHLLQVSISKKALLKVHLEPGLPPIEADGAQFQQVVMNLVTNASDALGDGEGAIALTTGTVDLDAEAIAARFPTQQVAPGRYVTLEVRDTGQGMSPEVMARIFDPFFTTKATGRGLGLSAMLGILRGHRAGLEIHSEVGRGSTFRIYFPAAKGRAVGGEARERAGASPLKGTVLLVDDEPAVLETLGPALETLGFRVLLARDGTEAVAQFQADPAGIDLVLMDLTMPRMDGREAFQAIRGIRPDARVVLSSGYTEQESVQSIMGQGLAGFLQKPYTLRILQETLQKALGA